MMIVMIMTMMLVSLSLSGLRQRAWPVHNPLGSQPEASIMHGYDKALSCFTVCAIVAITETLLPLQRRILIRKK